MGYHSCEHCDKGIVGWLPFANVLAFLSLFLLPGTGAYSWLRSARRRVCRQCLGYGSGRMRPPPPNDAAATYRRFIGMSAIPSLTIDFKLSPEEAERMRKLFSDRMNGKIERTVMNSVSCQPYGLTDYTRPDPIDFSEGSL